MSGAVVPASGRRQPRHRRLVPRLGRPGCTAGDRRQRRGLPPSPTQGDAAPARPVDGSPTRRARQPACAVRECRRATLADRLNTTGQRGARRGTTRHGCPASARARRVATECPRHPRPASRPTRPASSNPNQQEQGETRTRKRLPVRGAQARDGCRARTRRTAQTMVVRSRRRRPFPGYRVAFRQPERRLRTRIRRVECRRKSRGATDD
mmetsp:Transcript_3718/g.12021  ORF Transcript_3718/g.12021 Transcript_3718/m.12021 type:complete len:209 (+) Transcript_3718:659-1285(+)